MKIIDISWPITQQMTAYKDRSVVKIQPTKTFAQDQAREALITLGTHTGTHVDAPAHFIDNGKTVDQLSLEKLMGKCRVLDLQNVQGGITRENLMQHTIVPGEIILLKTSNSLLADTQLFDPEFVYLAHSGAQYLVESQACAVGIDYLGIERNQPAHETHIELLNHDMPIIEGLRLALVDAGIYKLICLPLNMPGLEAAPARALLLLD